MIRRFAAGELFSGRILVISPVEPIRPPPEIPMVTRSLCQFLGAVTLLGLSTPAALGYIHFPPVTMPKMCKESTNIRLMRVAKFDSESGVIVYEVVESLKGKGQKVMSFKHSIPKGTAGAAPIFDWVGVGKRAVSFTIEGKSLACGYVFIDEFCYSVDYSFKCDFWLLIRVDPDLAATYFGSAETLEAVAKDLLAGKDVKIPVDGSVKALTTGDRVKLAPALNDIFKKNRDH